jgi:glutamine synthetase type III
MCVQFTAPANVALFEELGVFSRRECEARRDVGLDSYIQVRHQADRQAGRQSVSQGMAWHSIGYHSTTLHCALC